MARTMLNANFTLKRFWAEAINTCYLQNRIYIRPLAKRTLFDYIRTKGPTYPSSIHLVFNVLF